MPHHRPKPDHKDALIRRKLINIWENEPVPEPKPVRRQPRLPQGYSSKLSNPPTTTNPFIREREIKEGMRRYPPQAEPATAPEKPVLKPTPEPFIVPEKPVLKPTSDSSFMKDPAKSVAVPKTRSETTERSVSRAKDQKLARQRETYAEQARTSGVRWNESTREYEEVPERPLGTARSSERQARELARQIDDIAVKDKYTKLSKIQALIRYAEHIRDGTKRWGSSGTKVTIRDPSYPHRVRFYTPEGIERANQHTFNSSFIVMRDFFKKHAEWDAEELQTLRDYAGEGALLHQRDYLVELGFLKEVNPHWVDMHPRRVRPTEKAFPASEPDGTKVFMEDQYTTSELFGEESGSKFTIQQQGNVLPPHPVTVRKVTIKTPVGVYDDPNKTNYGNTKWMKRTKYLKQRFTYEVTDAGKDYIAELFKEVPSDSDFMGQKVLQITDQNILDNLPENIEVESAEISSEEDTPKQLKPSVDQEYKRQTQAKQPQKALPAPKAGASKTPPLIEGGQRSGQRPVPPVPGTAKPTTPTGGGSVGLGPTRKRPKYREGGFVTF